MIIVTGATGFLGGAVASRLLADGQSVMAIGRDAAALSRLDAAGAKTQAWSLEGRDGVEALACRIEQDGMEVEGIVHCAALSAPFGSRKAFQDANVVATTNVALLAERIGASRLVHISSPAVYFDFCDQEGLREDSPLPYPLTHYARTKSQSERIVLEALPRKAVVLRPRGIYGPGDSALMPRLIKAAMKGSLPLLRGGRAVTDLTFVEDVVDAILAALAAGPDACGEVFNISGGEAINIRSLIDRIAERTGLDVSWKAVPVPVAMTAAQLGEIFASLSWHSFEPRVTRYSLGILAYSQTLDISKAERLLGWRPNTPFDRGFELSMTDWEAGA